MKNSILSIVIFLCSFNLFAQEKETTFPSKIHQNGIYGVWVSSGVSSNTNNYSTMWGIGIEAGAISFDASSNFVNNRSTSASNNQYSITTFNVGYNIPIVKGFYVTPKIGYGTQTQGRVNNEGSSYNTYVINNGINYGVDLKYTIPSSKKTTLLIIAGSDRFQPFKFGVGIAFK